MKFVALVLSIFVASLVGTPQSFANQMAPPKVLTPVFLKEGVVRARKGKKAIAGFHIRGAPTSESMLRMIDTRDGKEAMLIYVPANAILQVRVPLGTYRILVASGRTWYGHTHLFGPETQVYRLLDKQTRTDAILTFEEKIDYANKRRAIMGYRLALEGGPSDTSVVHEKTNTDEFLK